MCQNLFAVLFLLFLNTQSIAIVSGPKRDIWDWIAYSGNLLLVGAGIAGIIVAIKTLKRVSEQTKATMDAAIAAQASAENGLRSIRLQETQFRQWIVIENWTTDSDVADSPGDRKINVGFSIVNQTGLPLTLKNIETQARTLRMSTRIPRLLPPKQSYAADILLHLNDEEWRDLAAQKFIFLAIITVNYTDILARDCSQSFEYVVVCAPGQCTVSEIAHLSTEPLPDPRRG